MVERCVLVFDGRPRFEGCRRHRLAENAFLLLLAFGFRSLAVPAASCPAGALSAAGVQAYWVPFVRNPGGGLSAIGCFRTTTLPSCFHDMLYFAASVP